jgi:hypothetical protein
MIKLINLCPHDIIIRSESGERVLACLEPSGDVARVQEERTAQAYLHIFDANPRLEREGHVPIFSVKSEKIEGLPPPKAGHAFVVSSLVAEKLEGSRQDVFCPFGLFRNPAGDIIGCKGLTWRVGSRGTSTWGGWK